MDAAGTRAVSLISSAESQGYPADVLSLLRFVLLLLLTVVTLNLVIASPTPQTGPFEKVALGVIIVGVLALAMPVRRIGRREVTPA